MVNISDDLKVMLKTGSANALVKIECGNFVFGYNDDTAVDDNKVLELQINRIASYDDYPLGNAYSCYANITLWDIPANAVLKGQRTSVYVGYKVNESVEWIPLGVYYPEKPTRSGQCLSFTAYDKMYSLSYAYVPNISGSQTPIAVLEDLARAGNFELDESVYTTAAGDWDSISISLLYGQENEEGDTTSFSVSDCISYVAGYLGANAIFNREGKLTLCRFTDAVDENGIKYIIDDDCVNNVSVDESGSRVEYITCNNGTEEITASSNQVSASAKGIHISNPLIRTQSQLDKIKDTIFVNGVFLYRAVSLCHMCGNPTLDCYDVITYEDSDGNSYNFPLMSIEIIYDGSIVCNLQSFSKSADEQNQTGAILNRLIASSVSKQTQHLGERISEATESITNAVGGLVTFADLDEDGVPDALVAGEHKVDLAADSKWRTQGRCIMINKNGIGVSTTGADGPYADFAVYYDEKKQKYYLNADDIATGTLKGIKIIADDAVISGTVTATSGKIGKWDITHDSYQCLWYENKTQAMQLGNYGGQTGISGYEVLKSNSEYGELWYIRASGSAFFPKSSSERFECEGYTNSSGVTYDTLLISSSGSYIIGEPDSTNCVYFGTSSGAYAIKDTVIRGSNVRLYSVGSGGGVYLGSSGSTAVTSDENLKHLYDIDERYEKFFGDLEPLLYTYKQNGHRKHIGYGARKVKEALINADLTTEEFAGVVAQKDVTIYADENGTGEDITYDELYSLRYEEFIALNTHMIQKLLKRINSLEQKIEALEEMLNDNS